MGRTTVVRPVEIIQSRAFTLDPDLPIVDVLAGMSASLSSPRLRSYDFDSNNPTLIIAQHHLPYPERLKLAKADLEAHDQSIVSLQHGIQGLQHDVQELQHEVQELQRERQTNHLERQTNQLERQTNLTTQLNWETRSRIAQALNDFYVWQLVHQQEYIDLQSNGYKYLPVLLSSWAAFTNREPATQLIDVCEIDDEAMETLNREGAVLSRDLEESIQFVWDFIPELERNVMISMFLTRPNRNWIPHPGPTVDQGRHLIHLDPRISQVEKDFISDFIPKAVDRSKKPMFSSDCQ